MSRKWIVGLVALAAVAGTAFAAGSALSTDNDARPDYATLTVDLSDEKPVAARDKRGISGGKKKPRLVYLQSSAPTPVNTADASAGGLGPFVDLALRGCSKVIGGGVYPRNTDVFVQGSYVESPRVYHVLIALDDGAAATSPRPTVPVDTNLTCLKGVK